EVWDSVVQRCQRQRDEWLMMVRLNLGRLAALAGDWERLRRWVDGEESIKALRHLEATLAPKLRAPVERSSSSRVLRNGLRELVDSIKHFNERWQAYLQEIDLSEVNEQRDKYNRFYLLEKECAFRSARLARQGFRRLEPVSREMLADALPVLLVPALLK